MAARTPLDGLTGENAQQMVKFMKFFKSKKESVLTIVDADFNDARDMLSMDEYTRDEVSETLDSLSSVVSDGMRHELSNIVNMNVLLLKQIFEAADRQGAQLELDMGVIEDEHMLQELEDVRIDQIAEAKPTERRPSQLMSIKDEHQELMNEKNRVEEANMSLGERMRAVQQQNEAYSSQNKRLEKELERLREQVRHTESESDRRAQAKDGESKAAQDQLAAETKAAQDELAAVRGGAGETAAQKDVEIQRLRRELQDVMMRLEEAREAQTMRLNQAPQFQQMRKMLNQKNDQIKDLRKRLGEDDGLRAEDDF